MANENRIVRVYNDEVHKLISYVAKLTGSPYQHVFEEFLNYIQEGHVFGEYTHHKLIERILQKRSGITAKK